MLTNAYCEHCERSTAFEITRPDPLLNLVLAVVTLGLWCLAWVPMMIFGYRLNCTTCGTAQNGTVRKVIRGLSYASIGLTGIFWVTAFFNARPAAASRVKTNPGSGSATAN